MPKISGTECKAGVENYLNKQFLKECSFIEEIKICELNKSHLESVHGRKTKPVGID